MDRKNDQFFKKGVSDCYLMPTIFQLYHDENKLIFNEMMMSLKRF